MLTLSSNIADEKRSTERVNNVSKYEIIILKVNVI